MTEPSNKSSVPDCEFCIELKTPEHSTFARRYRRESRILFRQGGFVAVPTIGQIFTGHSLLLPEQHIERFADLHSSQRKVAGKLLKQLSNLVSQGQPTIMFEHGARCATGGSCGIYHAHFHVVPVPDAVSVQNLLPEGLSLGAISLADALEQVTQSDQYLVCRDSSGSIALKTVSTEEQAHYPSQYFRRKLAEMFSISNPWNWREYVEPEANVVRTLEMVSR